MHCLHTVHHTICAIVNDFLKLGSDFILGWMTMVTMTMMTMKRGCLHLGWSCKVSPKTRLADSHETRLYRGLVMKRLTVQAPKVDAGSM